MARPRTIADSDLLRAAREVLLERGAGATTAEAARRAGVSEATIFKRYKTKAAFFRAAMRPEPARWVAHLLESAGSGDARKNVQSAMVEAIEFFRVVAPLLTMAWAHPGESGLPDAFDVPEPPPLKALHGVTEYFRREIGAQRLPAGKPETLARIFLSSAERFVLFETLEHHTGESSPSPESFAADFVEALWPSARRT